MSDHVNRRVFIVSTAGIVVSSQTWNSAAAGVLAQAERRALAAAMDRIVPADGRMPAASSVGSVAYIEAVLARDAEIRKAVVGAVHGLGPDFHSDSAERQDAALRDLERNGAPAFALMRDLVYEAYYANPAVWKLLGYSFRRGPKRTAPLEPFDAAGLDRVRQMPRLYRPAE